MVGEEVAVVIPRPNTESNVEVAKPQIFNKEIGKVLDFLIVCKLKELFELTVIFFRLTNSLVTFQTMMNKICQS